MGSWGVITQSLLPTLSGTFLNHPLKIVKRSAFGVKHVSRSIF